MHEIFPLITNIEILPMIGSTVIFHDPDDIKDYGSTGIITDMKWDIEDLRPSTVTILTGKKQEHVELYCNFLPPIQQEDDPNIVPGYAGEPPDHWPLHPDGFPGSDKGSHYCSSKQGLSDV